MHPAASELTAFVLHDTPVLVVPRTQWACRKMLRNCKIELRLILMLFHVGQVLLAFTFLLRLLFSGFLIRQRAHIRQRACCINIGKPRFVPVASLLGHDFRLFHH